MKYKSEMADSQILAGLAVVWLAGWLTGILGDMIEVEMIEKLTKYINYILEKLRPYGWLYLAPVEGPLGPPAKYDEDLKLFLIVMFFSQEIQHLLN